LPARSFWKRKRNCWIRFACLLGSSRDSRGMRQRRRILVSACALSIIAPAVQGGSNEGSATKADSKSLYDIIKKHWYSLCYQHRDELTAGKVHVTFKVTAEGRVTGFNVTGDTASTVAKLSTEAVAKSVLPSMPRPMIKERGFAPIDCEATFEGWNNSKRNSGK
jgi:hypothetical protein